RGGSGCLGGVAAAAGGDRSWCFDGGVRGDVVE
nr:hypothetical protein [Tanacetum cinerariifolium]